MSAPDAGRARALRCGARSAQLAALPLLVPGDVLNLGAGNRRLPALPVTGLVPSCTRGMLRRLAAGVGGITALGL